jgi:hypothetical protein
MRWSKELSNLDPVTQCLALDDAVYVFQGSQTLLEREHLHVLSVPTSPSTANTRMTPCVPNALEANRHILTDSTFPQRSISRPHPVVSGPAEPEYIHNAACAALTAIAFALRFYKINHPDQVV